jgi:hypothetical protein
MQQVGEVGSKSFVYGAELFVDRCQKVLRQKRMTDVWLRSSMVLIFILHAHDGLLVALKSTIRQLA